MEREKPTLGTMPYSIAAEQRILELAGAIERRTAYGHGDTGRISIWAAEIIEQCRVIENMRQREQEAGKNAGDE